MARDCLVSRVFGRLSVIALAPSKNGRRQWSCICVCGGETTVATTSLLSGSTRSCGCLQADTRREQIRELSLMGQTFGRLTVQSEAGIRLVGRKKSPRRLWACLCSCGNALTATTEALKSGNTKSCGCYVTERITASRSPNASKLVSAIKQARDRAKVRGYVWVLTDAEVTALFCGDCFYCGAPPSKYLKGTTRNGIDRIDNSIGYIRYNCVSACRLCNQMKHTLSFEEFMIQLNKIASKHLSSKYGQTA